MIISEFLNTAPANVVIFAAITVALLSTVIMQTIDRVILKTFFWDKDGWIKKDKTKALKYYVALQVLFGIIFIGILILILN